MKQVTFQIDYTYCPKGHGDWIFIPSSTLCYDVFWCEKCDCFYEPIVKEMKKGKIKEQFNETREDDLKKRARFLAWKEKLQYKDMP